MGPDHGPDGAEREACDEGTFKDVNESATCITCEEGKYSSEG